MMVATIANRPGTEPRLCVDGLDVGVNINAPMSPAVLGNILHRGAYAAHSFSGRDMGRPYQLDLVFYPGREEEIYRGVVGYTGTPAIRISFARGTDELRQVTSTYKVALDQVTARTPVSFSHGPWTREYDDSSGRSRHTPQDHQMILDILASHEQDIQELLGNPDLQADVVQQRMVDPVKWVSTPSLQGKIPYAHLTKMRDFLEGSFGLDIIVQPFTRDLAS